MDDVAVLAVHGPQPHASDAVLNPDARNTLLGFRRLFSGRWDFCHITAACRAFKRVILCYTIWSSGRHRPVLLCRSHGHYPHFGSRDNGPILPPMEGRQGLLPACHSNPVVFALLSGRPLLSLLMRHFHLRGTFPE